MPKDDIIELLSKNDIAIEAVETDPPMAKISEYEWEEIWKEKQMTEILNAEAVNNAKVTFI